MEEYTKLSCPLSKAPGGMAVTMASTRYRQHHLQNKLEATAACSKVTTEGGLSVPIISRGVYMYCCAPKTCFAGRIWSSTLIWSFPKQGRG